MPIIWHVLHAASHLSYPSAAGRDPALPAWITPELIALTLATFQPYSPEVLTERDAVEMLMSAGNLFSLLSKPETEPHCDQEQDFQAGDSDQALRRAG